MFTPWNEPNPQLWPTCANCTQAHDPRLYCHEVVTLASPTASQRIRAAREARS